MPTFTNPTTDAGEASEALRGLAHATRAFDSPEDTYAVIGDLLGGVRSLRQVLHQLAGAHISHHTAAHTDDGDGKAGTRAAVAAADELHQASVLIDTVERHLDAASQHSGRIAWHPAAAERWISVVFLQGEEADAVLDLLNRDGTDAAISHLAGWDYGEDTTQAALENGHVYDTPPVGATDRLVTGDVYALTYSPFLGHVALLRRHDALPDPELLGIDRAEAGPRTAESTATQRERPTRREARSPEATDWFGLAPTAPESAGRGLAL
ncbi:hypothetical protein [Microbacterium lacticum]